MSDEWVDIEVKHQPRKDGPNKIILEVTPEDILQAIYTYAGDTRPDRDKWAIDPIAIAIRRQLQVSFVTVGWGYANTYLKDTKESWTLLPFKEVKAFLKQWHEDHFGLSPTTFEMFKDGSRSTYRPPLKGKPRRHTGFLQGKAKL